MTPSNLKGKTHILPALPPPVVRHSFGTGSSLTFPTSSISSTVTISILSATGLQIESDPKICLIQGYSLNEIFNFRSQDDLALLKLPSSSSSLFGRKSLRENSATLKIVAT